MTRDYFDEKPTKAAHLGCERQRQLESAMKKKKKGKNKIKSNDIYNYNGQKHFKSGMCNNFCSSYQ